MSGIWRRLSGSWGSTGSRFKPISRRRSRSGGGWIAATGGVGYATEAACAALDFAFDRLGCEQIVSFTAAANEPSRRVMERLGMTRDPADDFHHPHVPAGPLRRHVLYRIPREQWREQDHLAGALAVFPLSEGARQHQTWAHRSSRWADRRRSQSRPVCAIERGRVSTFRPAGEGDEDAARSAHPLGPAEIASGASSELGTCPCGEPTEGW